MPQSMPSEDNYQPQSNFSAGAFAARPQDGGLRDPTTGAQLCPGLVPGSEPFWPNRDPANPFPMPISHYKWLVFADPNWDWTFDFGDSADYQTHQKAEAKFAPILNATDPGLKAYRQRGGKLLQYHGWNDQLITPLNSINYYESVLSFFGIGQARERTRKDVQTFYRLFMAPGMTHCGGGPGPNTFDMQTALEQWVERGVAPDQIVAMHAVNGVVDRLRPLCPYPQVAVYKGKGDTYDAANFECYAATQGIVGKSVRRQHCRVPDLISPVGTYGQRRRSQKAMFTSIILARTSSSGSRRRQGRCTDGSTASLKRKLNSAGNYITTRFRRAS